MGVTNLRIVGMILLQATVVGLLGLRDRRRPGGPLRLARRWDRAGVFHSLAIVAGHGGAIVVICVLSSLLCVQKVIRLEPAIVFR